MRKPGRRRTPRREQRVPSQRPARSRPASGPLAPRRLREQELRGRQPVSATSGCCWDEAVCLSQRRHPAEQHLETLARNRPVSESHGHGRGEHGAGGGEQAGTRRGPHPGNVLLHIPGSNDVTSVPLPAGRVSAPGSAASSVHTAVLPGAHLWCSALRTGRQRDPSLRSPRCLSAVNTLSVTAVAGPTASGRKAGGPCVCRPACLGWWRINSLSKDETSRSRHLSTLKHQPNHKKTSDTIDRSQAVEGTGGEVTSRPKFSICPAMQLLSQIGTFMCIVTLFQFACKYPMAENRAPVAGVSGAVGEKDFAVTHRRSSIRPFKHKHATFTHPPSA